jgi:hypothetical protein
MLIHQRNTKKCLVIQASIEYAKAPRPLYVCMYCDHVYDCQSAYITHVIVCDNKDNYFNAIIASLTNTLKHRDSEIVHLNTKCESLNKELTTKIEEVKSLQDVINGIAEQPRNNSINNSILNMTAYDLQLSDVKRMITNDLHTVDILKFPESLVDWMHHNLLTDRTGNAMLCCTDPSRATLKYKMPNGEIGRDPGGTALMKMLFDGGLLKQLGTLESTTEDKNKKAYIRGVYNKVLAIRDKPFPFVKNHLIPRYIDIAPSLTEMVVMVDNHQLDGDEIAVIISDSDIEYVVESDSEDTINCNAFWSNFEHDRAIRHGIV